MSAILFALTLPACSALIVPDDLEPEPSDDGETDKASETSSSSATNGSTQVPQHPLDDPGVNCPDEEQRWSCGWLVDLSDVECELNCNLASPCPGFSIDFNVVTGNYQSAPDDAGLGCVLDALVAGDGAYLSWSERRFDDAISSDTVYEAWLLRPEELVLRIWHENSEHSELDPYNQSIQASVFDESQISECIDAQTGVLRYACLIAEITEAGCSGFGSVSCD